MNRVVNDPVRPTRRVTLRRCGADPASLVEDEVAVEEPLEIRVDGYPVAVVMRTPGHDGELTTGFLLTERIIPSPAAIRRLEIRGDENRALVFLQDDVVLDPGRLTRHLFASSSCGLCGKATLDAVFLDIPPLTGGEAPDERVLLEAPDALRRSQRAFDASGGLHAAGLFTFAGGLVVAREDIGRHNAVDKVIGHAAAAGIPADGHFLLVSGRVSFEIMQKALAAQIPLVAGISAPSSLAVEFARRSGQILVGFLRPPRFNRYS
jgi:FdhD protein